MLLAITYPSTPEETIGGLVVLGLIGAAIYALCRWLLDCPRTPDPWGTEIEQAVEADDSVPVCPHCLTPQQHTGWFCPECGATSGQYSNYLPNVYIFSIGEAARAGVEERNRWTPIVVTGYVLIAFAFFSILAPIYCLFLFLHRARITHLHPPGSAEQTPV